MLVSLTGEKNVAIGNNALETLTGGNSNVCIGYYAGYAATGSGNVLIGPADDANQTNATFEPPSAGGDRQLVIGSGTEAWIRGDATYDVTLNHNLTVDGNTTVKGNLTVNGSSSIVKSNIVQISDKTFEMGAVVSTTFAATVTDGTSNLTSITPTLGLIPGMEILPTTGGITIPAGTTSVSITNNTAVVSANITGNGTATITALGPSDTSAEGGGIIVKGTTDKSITYKHQDGGVTYNTWVSSEHMDLADNRHYSINGIYIADENTRTIGPNSGGGVGETNQTWTLGTAVQVTGGGGATVADAGNTNSNHYVTFNANASGSNQTINTDPNFFYNPAEDALKINGLIITQGGINGYTNQLNLSCANHSSTCSVKVGSVITTESDVIPAADNTDDLGSSAKRWANVYTADAHFNNIGTGGNEVDGTEGHWTMQEGADSMYLINRLTGKKFKIALTEVS